MKKRRLRFFLDYGICFWATDYEEGFFGGMMAKHLPLSEDVQHQVNAFLEKYDQHYSWGCPPSEGWTADDCQQFNAEYKRILSLVVPELANEFLLCQEQQELIEDGAMLTEFYQHPHSFVDQRKTNYYGWQDSFLDDD